MPQPSKAVSVALPKEVVSYSINHRRYNPVAFLGHVRSQYQLVKTALLNEKYRFAIVRLGLFPCVETHLLRRHGVPYAIKTLEDLDSLRIQKGIKGIIGKMLAPLDNRLVQRAVNGAMAIDVSTSEFISYHRARLGIPAEKMIWIDNAVCTKRFFPEDAGQARRGLGLDAFDPVLGYIGGRPHERGGRQIVEVLPRLKKTYPKVGAVIVGGGSGVNELKKLAQEQNVQEHCVFPGAVPYEDVPAFINAFDVGFGFDAVGRTSLFGNSSQKIRQYVACGKPAIASRGTNAFLEEHGLGSTVDIDDANGIYEATQEWLALADAEKEAHRHRACQYARETKSVEAMLDKRIAFWESRLNVVKPDVQ
ncbi:MAG: glycosyltransferase [Pirellulaceae bacterium]